MRIGLTGATGTLGRRLTGALCRGGSSVLPFAGDVRDYVTVREWVDSLDAVVHAAAIVPVRTVAARLDEAIAVNVAGTANVALAVADTPRCHLTYLSTSHVYAPSEIPLAEDALTKPVSLYGMTKLQGEEWVRLLAPESLIVRVFSFCDTRQQPPFLVPSLCRRIGDAAANAVLDLHGADKERDLAGSNWIAERCAVLVRQGNAGTVNCGTGTGHTVLEVARMLSRSFGRGDITWRPADARRGDRIVADISRLRDWIGVPPPDNLMSEFDDCAAAYRNERAMV